MVPITIFMLVVICWSGFVIASNIFNVDETVVTLSPPFNGKIKKASIGLL